MSQSLSKLYIHLVFYIKNPRVYIKNVDQSKLFAYIGTIIKDNGSIPVIINGVSDHVHILCVMSKNIALAKLIEEIKRHSNRWIKTQGEFYKQFAWQGGYAAFSVSQSLHDKTKSYIKNQVEHHNKMTFKDELIAFLEEYEIEYDERYLWTD
ncbi:MAG TPA: transposase [Sunxiuqinia sp.]|nr:transposase [Sunxiuqinia sp.]